MDKPDGSANIGAAFKRDFRNHNGSLRSVLTRIALATVGTVIFAAPQAAAQTNCTTTDDTETCSGPAGFGAARVNTPANPTPNTLNIRNVTGPITPAPIFGLAGIALVRQDGAAAGPLMLTLDSSVNLTALGVTLGSLVGAPQGAVEVIDTHSSATPAPDVILNSAANVTFERSFTAPTREAYFGPSGQINHLNGDIATINAALALNARLDEIIKGGFPDYASNVFSLLLPNPFNFQTLDPDVEKVLKANCIIRPGFQGSQQIVGSALLPLAFGAGLCWFVQPPSDKPEEFRLEADQYIALALDRIAFLSGPPRPEEAQEFWRAALVARADGNGVPSGNVFLTNSGHVTTRGDFTFGLLGISQSNGNGLVGTGNVRITNNGLVDTFGDSSIGVAALSQASSSDQDTTGNAGLVRVDGIGDINTRGSTSYGIYAAALGGNSYNNDGDRLSGNGGTVQVVYGGHATTTGIDAAGILALSKGGVGGNGVDAAGNSSQAGGVGGSSLPVYVEVQKGGSVVTTGDRAYAISASSIGGDGGEGGSGNDIRDASRGGSGGNGGTVTVLNKGALQTGGKDAYGIIATSFAGAGGLGGEGDSVFRGRGGNGGEAGDADNVTVDNGGTILTTGRGSFGILAQSDGGVAGNGGGSSGAFTSNAGDGGTRNTGRCAVLHICGDGGVVTITNEAGAFIETRGDNAYGVFAQSIGGGGGVGGDAGGWFSVSGGDGGDAGFGGVVIIDNYGGVKTSGDKSAAIFAQSIGGGGGAGGDASGGGQNVSVQIGGDGGAGGKGNNVTVTNYAGSSIVTSGQRSDGIFAQSVGGGGGVGGDASALVIGGFAVPVAIGGKGGGGGDAGDKVKVDNRGVIDVAGDYSNGIFAQSVGGGGGVGGSAYSFGASILTILSISTAVSIGGDGGDGGDGKEVEVDNSGSVTTRDFNAIGILAQSVGGGGGAGGSSIARALAINPDKGAAIAFSLAIGGDGGGGGSGGHVDINNDTAGRILTYGDQSAGVFAQSVGGGGGVGGDASAASETIAGGDSSEAKIDISIGGDGGSGGDGGNVDLINRGQIITLGDFSNGIVAQSVGGGGGFGGAGRQGDLFEDLGIPELPEFDDEDQDQTNADRENARTRYRNLQGMSRTSNPVRPGESLGRTSKGANKNGKSASVGVHVGIGGTGGLGGDGMKVDVKNYGEVVTGGFMSMGIFAQSVGGGGGEGGGGEADSASTLDIGAGIGGDGSSGGNGGEVLVLNNGNVTTLGEFSAGIFAQSVGGGGGAGAVGSGKKEDRSVHITMGGDGGTGGVGSHVRVDQTGNILTLGDGAIGIYAQSIGGGGGFGGVAEQGSILSISMGGSGGSAARDSNRDGSISADEAAADNKDSAGIVEVYLHGGRITTEGDGSHGIFAQSVGGGGGLAAGVHTGTYVYTIDAFGGIDIDTGLTVGIGNYGDGGSGGVGGDGKAVIVETSGLITTIGEGAHGIVAQSLGGGGGMGGSGGQTFPAAIGIAGSTGDPGKGGTINITHNGSIHTFGEGSVGIWAQSMSGSNLFVDPVTGAKSPNAGLGENITITLNNGEIIGGSGLGGAGIFVSGGKTNTITNSAGRISALSGNAIVTTDGADTVINSGLIDGNVGLGGGANAFNNLAVGLFQTREAIFLGAGNTLTNAGTLSPYSADEVGTTVMIGNLMQTASGVLKVNLNFNGPSDLLKVQGAASLNGKVTPVVGHASELVAGTWTTVLQATTLTNAGISIDHMDTLALDYAERFVGNQFQIGIAKIDMDIAGLNAQESSLVDHLEDIRTSGAGQPFNALLDSLMFGTDAKAYMQTLDNLHPYAAFSEGDHFVLGAQGYLSGMMSCPQTENGVKPWREASCVWVRGSYVNDEQDPTGNDPGYEGKAARMQMGYQADLGDGWFAGYSIGYEAGSFNISDTAQASSDSMHFGGALKREIGPFLFAGAVDAAHTSTDRTRLTGFPTLQTATSSNDTLQLSLRLRAAATAEFGNFYLRPSVDIDSYYVGMGHFAETGAGIYDLIVPETDQTMAASTASLTAGFVQDFGGWQLHPFAEYGVTRMDTDSFDMSAHFEGAAAGVADFTISSAVPKELHGGRLGLEALLPMGSLRLEYEQRDGGGFEARSASVKARFAF